jgi:hypothetical protein
MERQLYRSLFKQRTQLSDADLDSLKFLDHPVVKAASFAQQKGIIQHVGMPGFPQAHLSLMWTTSFISLVLPFLFWPFLPSSQPSFQNEAWASCSIGS